MVREIDNIIMSMGHRKLLFLIGDHLSGKTDLVKEYLNKRYGDRAEEHYVDVGLYIQKNICKDKLDLYKIFPEEFNSDVEILFNQLIDDKYEEIELLVFDHMEFLLSEEYTGWIKLLDKVTLNEKTAIVVVPKEYKGSLPLNAYRYIEI